MLLTPQFSTFEKTAIYIRNPFIIYNVVESKVNKT